MKLDTALILGAICAITTLGCSGDDPPTDMGGSDSGVEDTGETEDVETADGGTDATDTREEDADGEPQLVWEPCGIHECATIEAPLDYDDPDGESVELRVLRREAPDAANRLGVLMFNPGGPGISSIMTAPRTTGLFAQWAPKFDLLLLDNRGTGDSGAVDCAELSDFEDEINTLPMPVDDLADAQAHEALWQRFFDGCVETMGAEYLRHLNSENVARDMDTVRAALGEEKLNFLGGSYGTIQGALYATMFPERVRAFVLDAPTGWYLDKPADDIERALVWDAGIMDFFDACGADAGCAFHGGEGAAAVQTAYVALRDELATGTVESRGAVKLPHHLDQAMTTGMTRANLTEFSGALASAENGDWDALFAIGASANPVENVLAFKVAQANETIRLADMGCPAGYDAQAFLDAATEVRDQANHVELTLIAASCIVYDLERSEPRIPIGPTTAPPVLILAGEHDPSVSMKDATDMQAALDNDSYLVTWEGFGHPIGPTSDCTADAISAFLENPEAPAQDTCPQTAGHFQ